MSEPESEKLKSENPFNASVPKLAEGLLEHYQEPLEKIEKDLKELTLGQSKAIIQLHNENLSLSEQCFSPELQDMIKKINEYHGKLSNIKKNMKHLHERSSRLKTRALKMEQYTEKLKIRQIQKELDLKKEEELIGSGPSTSTQKLRDETT